MSIPIQSLNYDIFNQSFEPTVSHNTFGPEEFLQARLTVFKNSVFDSITNPNSCLMFDSITTSQYSA
jgi:hypothetical protein